MNEILMAILFLTVLAAVVTVVVGLALKRSSKEVCSSRHILNNFQPDNTAPKLTEMIEFHKNNGNLSKYNIG